MTVTTSSTQTLASAFAWAVSTYGELPCVRSLVNRKAETRADRYATQTYAEFGARAFRLAHYFRSIGLERGDRVMVLGGNCAETVLVHAACSLARLATISPYVGENSHEIRHELLEARPRLIVVENRRLLEKFGELSDSNLLPLITMRPIPSRSLTGGLSSVLLEDILTSEEYPATEPSWLHEVCPTDDALILYTATKHGHTRGVIHTQASVLANIEFLHGIGLSRAGLDAAVIPPLGHLYPIYMMWLFLTKGLTTILPSVPGEHPKVDVGGMIQCLRDGDASVIPVVPYFLDLMKEEVEKRYVEPLAYFLGVLRRPTPAFACPIEIPFSMKVRTPSWNLVGFLQFRSIATAKVEEFKNTPPHATWKSIREFFTNVITTLTVAAAVESHEALRVLTGGEYPPGVCRIDYRSGRPLVLHLLWRYILAPIIFLLTGGVRRQIRQSCFGRRISDLIVGGSRLFFGTQQFWEALGIWVLQGYGLTQVGITHAQRRGCFRRRPEVVGPPLSDGILQRIDPVTRELWLSSNTMFSRYVTGDFDETELGWIDGRLWYRTTDRAQQVSNDGTIRITDNLTRMYNSLGGEKVYPFATAEPALDKCPYVKRSMVWGDAQPFNVAIVSPDPVHAALLAEDLGLSLSELYSSEEFIRLLMEFISSQVNPNVPLPARIRSVIVAREEFSTRNGFLNEDGTINTHTVLIAHEATLAGIYKRQLV